MKAKRPSRIRRDLLGSDQRRRVDITPPEGVVLHFEVARFGARLAAQIIDILLTLGPAVLIVLLLLLIGIGPGAAFLAVAALLFFFIRAPYYVACELIWNGQTLGKRISRLRVISATGRSLSAHQVVARNLMKEMEVFVPGTFLLIGSGPASVERLLVLVWILTLVAIPLFNRRRQRIGDIIADTLVIHQPAKVLVPDLAAVAARQPRIERFGFLPAQLDHYGAFELQVLESVLQSRASISDAAQKRQRETNLATIADRIRTKISYTDRVDPDETEAFLRAFYVAQRAHLERRQLYGDVRADKFHSEAKAEPE